jgi:hypothetical protein
LETKIIRITPSMARDWLESNTINRPLRSGVVAGYVKAYERGEHRLTHQGIAFADTGELLDGQHRLTAIAQLPDHFGLDMMVTRGLHKTAFDVIDQGLKRSHGDALYIPAGLASVARYLANIVETSRSGITSQYLVPFVRGVEAPYSKLTSFCSKATKTWSSAAIRSAAILRMLNGGDHDYICISYYALNHAEFGSMSPAVQSLYRQVVKTSVSPRGFDLFGRAFKAFDFRKQGVERLQINDTSSVAVMARSIIQTKVLGMKKAPEHQTESRSAVSAK